MSSTEIEAVTPQMAMEWYGAWTRHSHGIPGDEPFLVDPKQDRIDVDVVTYKAEDWARRPESRSPLWTPFEFESLGERWVRATRLVFSATRVRRRPDESAGPPGRVDDDL